MSIPHLTSTSKPLPNSNPTPTESNVYQPIEVSPLTLEYVTTTYQGILPPGKTYQVLKREIESLDNNELNATKRQHLTNQIEKATKTLEENNKTFGSFTGKVLKSVPKRKSASLVKIDISGAKPSRDDGTPFPTEKAVEKAKLAAEQQAQKQKGLKKICQSLQYVNDASEIKARAEKQLSQSQEKITDEDCATELKEDFQKIDQNLKIFFSSQQKALPSISSKAAKKSHQERKFLTEGIFEVAKQISRTQITKKEGVIETLEEQIKEGGEEIVNLQKQIKKGGEEIVNLQKQIEETEEQRQINEGNSFFTNFYNEEIKDTQKKMEREREGIKERKQNIKKGKTQIEEWKKKIEEAKKIVEEWKTAKDVIEIKDQLFKCHNKQKDCALRQIEEGRRQINEGKEEIKEAESLLKLINEKKKPSLKLKKIGERNVEAGEAALYNTEQSGAMTLADEKTEEGKESFQKTLEEQKEFRRKRVEQRKKEIEEVKNLLEPLESQEKQALIKKGEGNKKIEKGEEQVEEGKEKIEQLKATGRLFKSFDEQKSYVLTLIERGNKKIEKGEEKVEEGKKDVKNAEDKIRKIEEPSFFLEGFSLFRKWSTEYFLNQEEDLAEKITAQRKRHLEKLYEKHLINNMPIPKIPQEILAIENKPNTIGLFLILKKLAEPNDSPSDIAPSGLTKQRRIVPPEPFINFHAGDFHQKIYPRDLVDPKRLFPMPFNKQGLAQEGKLLHNINPKKSVTVNDFEASTKKLNTSLLNLHSLINYRDIFNNTIEEALYHVYPSAKEEALNSNKEILMKNLEEDLRVLKNFEECIWEVTQYAPGTLPSGSENAPIALPDVHRKPEHYFLADWYDKLIPSQRDKLGRLVVPKTQLKLSTPIGDRNFPATVADRDIKKLAPKELEIYKKELCLYALGSEWHKLIPPLYKRFEEECKSIDDLRDKFFSELEKVLNNLILPYDSATWLSK